MTLIFRCNGARCGLLYESKVMPPGWQACTRTVDGVYLGMYHRCDACSASNNELVDISFAAANAQSQPIADTRPLEGRARRGRR